MEQSLSINYSLSSGSGSSGGSVIIEPADLKDNLDHVSRLDAIKYMAAKLYGSDMPGIDCIQDGTVVVPVYVYPFPFDLNYTFKSCVGSVGAARVAYHQVSEILDFSGDDTRKPKYPVRMMLTAAWQGEVFDKYGGLIPWPTWNLVDGEVVLSGDAVGNLEINYLTVRHTYNITLSDIDLIGGKFTTWVYAVWDGGVEWQELTAPPCVDVADDDFGCGWGHGRSRTIIDPGDDDDPPVAYPDDNTIQIDYCTQQAEE